MTVVDYRFFSVGNDGHIDAGRIISLTAKGYDLLLFQVQHPDTVITKYGRILDSLKGLFVTDCPPQTMSAIVRSIAAIDHPPVVEVV